MSNGLLKSLSESVPECPQEAHIATFPPGPFSQSVFAELDNVIGNTNIASMFGITLASGSGPYVSDFDGNTYLDCLAGASANILGYGIDAISEYMARAASQIQHTCFGYTPNVYALMLAEALLETCPDESPRRILLGLSGSDACGGAIEVMRKSTHRMGIVHFDNAYHGSTGLSQQASGYGDLNAGIYPPSPDFVSLPYPETDAIAESNLAEIERQLRSGQVGGVIAETIQGDNGVRFAAPGFFTQLKGLLERYEALLILDEIQAGMGRTGSLWAFEQEGVTPDLWTSAKGLSAGYAPVSAIIGSKDAVDALAPAQQLFTYTGHAPSCAAAYATLTMVIGDDVIGNAATQGSALISRLRALQAEFPDIISDVRGRGLMIGMEIVNTGKQQNAVVFATRGVELGVYFGYFGVHRNVVRIEPPLNIGPPEIDLIVQVASTVAGELRDGTIPEQTYENIAKYSGGL